MAQFYIGSNTAVRLDLWMAFDEPARYMPLRIFLTIDATLLLALGLALMFVPDSLATEFHFGNLPASVDYIGGILGCVFFSLGIGYVVATGDPLRHVMWIWIGIARATFEVIFSVVCVIRGIVTWPQASFAIVVAAVIAIGYAVFYPRDLSS